MAIDEVTPVDVANTNKLSTKVTYMWLRYIRFVACVNVGGRAPSLGYRVYAD